MAILAILSIGCVIRGCRADFSLDVRMDRCMKIDHARLYGGLGFVGVYTGVISSKRPRWLPF